MANVIVTEYASEGYVNGNRAVQCPQAPIIATQVVAIGGTSAAITNAANAETSLLYVFAEADCYVSLGTGPTASATNGHPLAADQGQWFRVNPGSSYKVACISRTVS